MLPFDSIPTSIRRCIHYFIFTTAAIIVAVGLLIMQRKKGKVGDYIVVTGVLVLMIGILLLSKEYRGRGAPSLPTRTQASTEQQPQPPRNDPPPSYSDTWRESYLQDQEKKKAELDPPPPAYRESWSKGLWKKYFQSGRIGCDNHLCELNASTLSHDVENAASLPTPKPNDVSQDPSSLQENECAPPITPVLVPPAGEGSQTSAASLENRAPGLERRASFASTSTASESSERVRQRSCSVTQLSSMFENTPTRGPELPTISRGGDGGAGIIEPSQFVYVYESGRHWVVDN